MGVKYKDLGLKVKSDISIVKIGDNEVSVKSFLSTDKKAAIVRNAIKGAFFDGYVDEILCEAYLHMMIIENYTDIDFEEQEFDDILQVFDELDSCGVLAAIIDGIDPSEYNYIIDAVGKAIQAANLYAQSYAAGIQTQSEVIKALAANNETE